MFCGPNSNGVMFAVDAGDLDDDEPDAWPEPEQRKLDESMRCSICQECFTMPVSFSTCTHTCALTPWRTATLDDRSLRADVISITFFSPHADALSPHPRLTSQTAHCASDAR